MIHRNRFAVFALSIALLASAAPQAFAGSAEDPTAKNGWVWAQGNARRERPRVIASARVPGKTCHGANIFNGEQLTNYEKAKPILPPDVFEFWTNFIVPEVGVQGAGPDADIITALTPEDAVMATKFIGTVEEFNALPLEVQQRMNQPLHDAYMVTDMLGNRSKVPGTDEGTHKFFPQRTTTEPITLEDWNEAEGGMRLKCFEDGTGSVVMKAKNLIPNGIYTAWQVFAATNPPEGFDPSFGPIGFGGLGGASMAITADEDGAATFERKLNYCPLELENPLMYTAFLYHNDHSLYGAMPMVVPEAAGTVADHVCYPVGDYVIDSWVAIDDDDDDEEEDD